MNKYQEASQYYNDMIKYWKEYDADRSRVYSHGCMISNAAALAKLDLPDPFKELAAKKEAKNEAKEELKEEPVTTGFVITEPVKEEEAKTTVASVSEEKKSAIANEVKHEPIKANFDKKDNWTSWNKSYKK